MRPSNQAVFCKQRNCPSTETVLLYLASALPAEEQEDVARHLETCDFCGAEIQLLAHFGRAEIEDDCPQSEIPLFLRIYAERKLRPPLEVQYTSFSGPKEQEALLTIEA